MQRERKRIMLGQFKWILFFISALLSLVMFLLIAIEIGAKRQLFFDEPILFFIHSYTSPLFTSFFAIITHLGDSIVVLVIAALLSLFLMFKKMYRKIFLIAFSIGGIVLGNAILKMIFQRNRPNLWQHIVEETNFSFPSGHAMLSAALTIILVILFWNSKFRWLAAGFSIAAMILVGLSRLYLGVHFPSDIIAGWSLSIAWISFAMCILLSKSVVNLSAASK